MNAQRSGCPSEIGYFMPAEWHPHSATWLVWPTNTVTWPDGRLERVREAYTSMIRALSGHERVHLLVDDGETEREVHDRLTGAGVDPTRLFFQVVPTVDGWIRDYGPNFLVHPASSEYPLAFNKWTFNAWGNKYPDLAEDNSVVDRLGAALDARMFRPLMVLEGGSIDVNGEGLCLTTRQCLLNPNRNPALATGRIEGMLKDHLGVDRVIWLDEGIVGDDTDGHIDDIARFVAPDLVLCAVEEDPTDANFATLHANYEWLCHLSRRENLFRVIPLPMPEPVFADGERLPASYANFFIANALVLVPVFGQTRDRAALDLLESIFPHRRVLGIPALDMVYGLGSIHCLTQQQPATSR